MATSRFIAYSAIVVLSWCAGVTCLQSGVFDSLCRNSRHNVGRWVFNPNVTKSFECCSWDKEGFYGNTPAKCGHSPLGYPLTYNGQPDKLSQTGGHACRCDHSSRKEVKDREKYDWVPSYCELLPWNSTQFCELLGKRSVLMVGDSTMQQTATTLMSLIAESGSQCAPQITSSRSDLLSVDGKNNYDKFVIQQKPDICIVGVGAHLHDFYDFEAVWAAFDARWNNTVQQSPNTRFFFKTMNPGHSSHNFTTAPDDFWLPAPKQFAQYQFNLQPQIDAACVERALKLGMRVIDMAPLYLRRDAHSDGQHLCLPGPLNIIGNIMLTMLYTGEM